MGNGANIVAENFVFSDVPYDPNDIVGKKLSHGCNLFVQDHDARQAFIAFIRGGTWVDHLNDESTSHSIAEERTGIVIPKVVEELPESTLGEKRFAEYDIPVGGSKFSFVRGCFSSFNSKKAEEEKAARLATMIETCFSVSHMRTMLLATIFPLFLQSPEYANLLHQQTMDSNAPSSGALSRMDSGMTDSRVSNAGSKIDSRLQELFSSEANTPAFNDSPPSPNQRRMPPRQASIGMVIGDDGQEHDERLADVFVSRPRPLKDLIACALRTVDPKEMQYLLQSGSWFQDLVVAVEDLPISVSLATAREDRRGFPLVYVNKSFERETGYSRKEIVGQNCRFLQSRETEREQIYKMQTALRCAQPVKVALTNVRKDGEEFFNLLAMKPIFNSHGIYSYVVGVQYDISHQKASLRELRVVNELLTFLPNVLKL